MAHRASSARLFRPAQPRSSPGSMPGPGRTGTPIARLLVLSIRRSMHTSQRRRRRSIRQVTADVHEALGRGRNCRLAEQTISPPGAEAPTAMFHGPATPRHSLMSAGAMPRRGGRPPRRFSGCDKSRRSRGGRGRSSGHPLYPTRPAAGPAAARRFGRHLRRRLAGACGRWTRSAGEYRSTSASQACCSPCLARVARSMTTGSPRAGSAPVGVRAREPRLACPLCRCCVRRCATAAGDLAGSGCAMAVRAPVVMICGRISRSPR